jgi:MFS family permease
VGSLPQDGRAGPDPTATGEFRCASRRTPVLPRCPFWGPGRELAASPVEVTMLFEAYSFGDVFGEILWGRSSDRFGQKRILILTTACAAVSYPVFTPPQSAC